LFGGFCVSDKWKLALNVWQNRTGMQTMAEQMMCLYPDHTLSITQYKRDLEWFDYSSNLLTYSWFQICFLLRLPLSHVTSLGI